MSTAYTLTPQERQTLLDINTTAVQHKARIHDLNAQLETAIKERDGAQALFSGALAMLANSHDLAGAQLSTDFTTLTKG